MIPDGKRSPNWPTNDPPITNDPHIGLEKIPELEMVTLSVIKDLGNGFLHTFFFL